MKKLTFFDNVKTPKPWLERALAVSSESMGGGRPVLKRSFNIGIAAAAAAVILGLILLPGVALRRSQNPDVGSSENSASNTVQTANTEKDYFAIYDAMYEKNSGLSYCTVLSTDPYNDTVTVSVETSLKSNMLVYNNRAAWQVSCKLDDDFKIYKETENGIETYPAGFEDIKALEGHRVLLAFDEEDLETAQTEVMEGKQAVFGINGAADFNGFGVHCLFDDRKSISKARQMEKQYDQVKLAILLEKNDSNSNLTVNIMPLFGGLESYSKTLIPQLNGVDYTYDEPSSGLITKYMEGEFGDLVLLGFNGRSTGEEGTGANDALILSESLVRSTDESSLMGYCNLGKTNDPYFWAVVNTIMAAQGVSQPDDRTRATYIDSLQKCWNSPTSIAESSDSGSGFVVDSFEPIASDTYVSNSDGTGADLPQRLVISIASEKDSDLTNSGIIFGGQPAAEEPEMRFFEGDSFGLDLGGSEAAVKISTAKNIKIASLKLVNDVSKRSRVYLLIDILPDQYEGIFTDTISVDFTFSEGKAANITYDYGITSERKTLTAQTQVSGELDGMTITPNSSVEANSFNDQSWYTFKFTLSGNDESLSFRNYYGDIYTIGIGGEKYLIVPNLSGFSMDDVDAFSSYLDCEQAAETGNVEVEVWIMRAAAIENEGVVKLYMGKGDVNEVLRTHPTGEYELDNGAVITYQLGGAGDSTIPFTEKETDINKE